MRRGQEEGRISVDGSSGSPFSDDITTEEQAKSLLTIEHFVDEVQTVVDYFGFDEFIICGHNASPEARPCPFKIREIYDMFYLKRTIDHQSFWEAIFMMYPYIKLPDDTEIVHSEILEGNRIFVHFERPTENGFDSVRFELPSYDRVSWEGNYTEDEMESFVELLRHHAHLIYRYAAEGGVNIA